MITVVSVVETTPSESIAFDKTYKEFSDVKLSIEIDKKLTLIAEDGSDRYSIDLSTLLSEKAEINGFSLWTEFEAFLTTGLLNIYAKEAAIPRNLYTRTLSGNILIIPNPDVTKLTGGPDIISVTHELTMTMEYGSRLNPALRNNQNLKWHLPEVIFKHNDINNPVVNFTNTIPIINGKIFMPVPFNDELYALGGTSVLSSIKPGGMSNILMDFSPMGGIQIVKFSDSTQIASTSGTMVQLPAGLDMRNKSYFLVIAGRMFLPHESKLLAEDVLFFDIANFNLDNILLSNKHLERDFITGTSIVTTTGSENYISSIWDADHEESFIVVINKSEVTFNTNSPIMHITDRLMKFPPNAGGILMRNMTREITDYSRQFDSDATVVHTSDANAVNRIQISSPTDTYNLSYAFSKQISFDRAVNSEDGSYTLIDIMSGN